jgi:hypothetical protein
MNDCALCFTSSMKDHLRKVALKLYMLNYKRREQLPFIIEYYAYTVQEHP